MKLGHTGSGVKLDDREGDAMTPPLGRTFFVAALVDESAANSMVTNKIRYKVGCKQIFWGWQASYTNKLG